MYRFIQDCFLNAFSRKVVSWQNFGCGSIELAHESRLSVEILTISLLTYTLHSLLGLGQFT